MSANPAFVDFCTRVCACVRFRPDHPSIQRELMGHLEDRYDAILEQEKGILLADAQARTVAAMGDPESLGRYLDQMHSPFWGWLQIWLRRAVWLLAAGTIVLALLRLEPLRACLTAPVQHGYVMEYRIENNGSYEILADWRPPSTLRAEDYTFSIERAILARYRRTVGADGEAGDVLSLALTLKAANINPWLRGPDLSWLYARDDLGNRYYASEEIFTTSLPNYVRKTGSAATVTYPFSSYYDVSVSGIDPAAAEVTLIFDRYGENTVFLTIPLKGGAGHG